MKREEQRVNESEKKGEREGDGERGRGEKINVKKLLLNGGK